MHISFLPAGGGPAAPYVPSVTESLIVTLEYQSGIEPPELAGYAANIDFWMSEVRHRLALIDGYPQRFRVFAEAAGGQHRKMGESGSRPAPNLTEGILEELRRRLVRATARWIAHVSRHGLIEIAAADELRHEFDIPYGRP